MNPKDKARLLAALGDALDGDSVLGEEVLETALDDSYNDVTLLVTTTKRIVRLSVTHVSILTEVEEPTA